MATSRRANISTIPFDEKTKLTKRGVRRKPLKTKGRSQQPEDDDAKFASQHKFMSNEEVRCMYRKLDPLLFMLNPQRAHSAHALRVAVLSLCICMYVC